MKPILIFLLMLNQAFAGNSVGNGGDVVECPGSVILLDFFEAKELHKKELIRSDLPYKEIITERLTQLQKFAPGLSSLYEKKLQQFKVEIKKEIVLKDLKDEDHVFLPKGCGLKQIAHKMNSGDSSMNLLINDSYWSRLDQVNRAGLLMHEAVYDHFRFFKIKNSSGVRKFIALLFSQDFHKTEPKEIKKLFLELEIPFDK